MAKMRLTTSFRDAINDTRAIFGRDDNDMKFIVKRALMSFKKAEFEYSIPKDKTLGNPVTINTDFRTDEMKDFIAGLKSKQIQGIVIAFCQMNIEKNASRRQSALVLDECENYIIKGE